MGISTARETWENTYKSRPVTLIARIRDLLLKGVKKMKGLGAIGFMDEMEMNRRHIQRARVLILSDLSYLKSASIDRLRAVAQVPEICLKAALEQLKQEGKIKEVVYDIPVGKAIFYHFQ